MIRPKPEESEGEVGDEAADLEAIVPNVCCVTLLSPLVSRHKPEVKLVWVLLPTIASI